MFDLFLPLRRSGPGRPANVVLLPVAGDPTISYPLLFHAGSQDDPPGKEGLAALTARMLAEGSTKQHRYQAILDLLFPMAGGYAASCSVEDRDISGRIHKDNLADFIRSFAGGPLARLPQEDLDRIRSDRISYLENSLRYSSDEELAKAVLYETIFAGTPYGHIPAGHVKSLKSITLDDVRVFYCALRGDNYRDGSGRRVRRRDPRFAGERLALLPPSDTSPAPPRSTPSRSTACK